MNTGARLDYEHTTLKKKGKTHQLMRNRSTRNRQERFTFFLLCLFFLFVCLFFFFFEVLAGGLPTKKRGKTKNWNGLIDLCLLAED